MRNKVRFAQQNLLDSFTSRGRFHVILCRNVLIHQTVEAKKEIIGRMYEALVPGGILMLGSAETLFGISDAFAASRIGPTTLYQRPL